MGSIVIVEDNNEILHYLCTVLRAAGYKVTGVSTVYKCVEVLRAERFAIDLLILDVQLGDGTAFDFLEHLAVLNPLFTPKICFVSSNRDAETIRRAVSFGASDYIVKPILTGTLLAKVNTLLGEQTETESFSSANCNFEARLTSSDIVQPDIIVTEVTEAGVRLRASVRFQVGALVALNVDELQQILQHDADHMVFKITKTERIIWGKYISEAEFVGISEEKISKLRSLTIQGKFLQAQTIKKMA
jgi:two-component system, cell cycle response regulator DivK